MTARKRKAPPASPAEEISRGLRAKRELEQTSEAFDDVRAGFLEALAATKLGESDARERLYLAVQVVDAVRDALVAKATRAPMAEYDQAIKKVMNGGQ